MQHKLNLSLSHKGIKWSKESYEKRIKSIKESWDNGKLSKRRKKV